MDEARVRTVAAVALVIGAALGMAGTFAPTDSLRSLLWLIDGTSLVIGAALLVVHHVRRGDELLAAGFLVFLVGETLIIYGSVIHIGASAPVFAAGAALWAGGLGVVSASSAMPGWVRGAGAIAALLFAATSVQIAFGTDLSPLARPLPFFAYPFFALALIGWALQHARARG